MENIITVFYGGEEHVCMAVYKKYGATFRKLRKQRGFKLTSFEDVGISSASLCKFERGISLLKFDKLVLALGELSITLSEYEKCLNNYELDSHELLIQKVIIAIVSDRVEELPDAYREAIKIREDFFALAIKGVYSDLSIDDKDALTDYLESVVFWRYTDLYTFHLCLDWMELPQIYFIIEGYFTNNLEIFNSLEHRNRVSHIICHTAMIYISKGYSEKAQHVLGYIRGKGYKHTMFTKNMMNFVIGFWESEFGTREYGVFMMKESLKTFDLLSFPGMSDYYRRLYKKYSLSINDI